MSNFISIDDYDATIHREILDAVTRSDTAIIEICENRALAEMQSYLSARYDTQKMFSEEGDARNQLVLMMAIDIAVYHLLCIHNPMKLSAMRKERYERAVEWLKQVAASKISIPSAPLLPIEEQKDNGNPWSIRSNNKRKNHF